MDQSTINFAQSVVWPNYFNPSQFGAVAPPDPGTSAADGKGADWVDKVMGWLNTGSQIYQNTQNNNTTTTTGTGTYTPVPADNSMGLGTKVAIGAAAVLLIGGIVYMAGGSRRK